LKFCKYVLINELYKNKSFYGKKLFGINALLLPNYKKHFGAQIFQGHNIMHLIASPLMFNGLPWSKFGKGKDALAIKLELTMTNKVFVSIVCYDEE
jgi:hypothetical protein